MRKSMLFSLLILLVAAGLPAVAAEGFRSDRKAAFDEAAREARPLLIDFQTTWCVACRTMEKSTWIDPDVVAAMQSYVPLVVDGERDRNLVARYRVEAYPTIVIATAEGAPILTLVGLQTAKQMRSHLDAVSERLDQLASWAGSADSRKPDPEAILGLAEFALERDSGAEAERLFRELLRRKKNLEDTTRIPAQLGLARALIELEECKDADKVLRETSPQAADDNRWAPRLQQVNEALESCQS